MKAKIKDVHSPDIPTLKDYRPKDNFNFCFYLEILVGPDSKKGEEIFGITVCTPNWLINNHSNDTVLFLHHHLLVFEYNYIRIVNAIKNKIQSFSADNWEELSLKISKIAHWEFENYQ